MEEIYTQTIAWYKLFEAVGKIWVSAPKRVTRYLWGCTDERGRIYAKLLSTIGGVFRSLGFSIFSIFQLHFSIFKRKVPITLIYKIWIDILQIGM
jgi:hypothetical protein